MNLGPHICSRNSRDFANRGCIEVFEIEQHDFTIQRLEAMNQLQQSLAIQAIMGLTDLVARVGHGLDFFQGQPSP